MTYFEQLIPSKFHYFEKFNELDEQDLKIIFAMIKKCPDGPRNISTIAEELGLPQQIVNNRVSRYDEKDLVRFRAVINEALLGLTNYAVVVSVKPGLLYENKKGGAVNAGTFLTCYPIWRLLEEVFGGDVHGFYSLYSIPCEKENDLKLFLNELIKINCIKKINEFCRVTQSFYNIPSLESFISIKKTILRKRLVSFSWDKWIDDFDKAEESSKLDRLAAKTQKCSFSYNDLLILFHLERNLREKFANIAKEVGETATKVTQHYKEIIEKGLIIGCKFEIYPIDPRESIHLLVRLEFASAKSLRKLISHLDQVPYPIMYEKIEATEALFIHAMIPSVEYFDFRNTFEKLARQQGIIQDINLYASNFYAKFDNIMLFEAFSEEENKWAFSLDAIHQALQKLLENTKFKF